MRKVLVIMNQIAGMWICDNCNTLATVSFDSSKTSTKEISSFITGIAGGDAYTASELKSKKSLSVSFKSLISSNV